MLGKDKNLYKLSFYILHMICGMELEYIISRSLRMFKKNFIKSIYENVSKLIFSRDNVYIDVSFYNIIICKNDSEKQYAFIFECCTLLMKNKRIELRESSLSGIRFMFIT